LGQFAVSSKPTSSLVIFGRFSPSKIGWIFGRGTKDHPRGKRGGHSVVGGKAECPALALGMLGESAETGDVSW